MSSPHLTSAADAPTTLSPDGPEPENTGPQPVLLLPGDRFFVRTIALAEDTSVEDQVILALEGLSPFGPAQLYYGYVTAPDRKSALAYAAYRRRFTADETATWEQTGSVLPEFLPLLASRPKRDGVVLHQGPARITGLAWRNGEALPSVLLVRECLGADQQKFAAELCARAGLPADAEVTVVQGPLNGAVRDDGDVELRVAGTGTIGGVTGAHSPFVLRVADLDMADVRDREFLAARERAARRDNWLWRGVQLIICLIIGAALVEVGASLLRWQATKRQARIAAQTSDVEHLLTAQGLAQRIGELSERRLMPLEMLALINPGRPQSITFLRVVTRSATELEIEAQSKTPADVSTYQEVLRNLPAIASEQTRINRSSEGLTSFIITLAFKPDALRAANGAPVVPPGARKPEPPPAEAAPTPVPLTPVPAAGTVEVEPVSIPEPAVQPAAPAPTAPARATPPVIKRVILPGLTPPPEPEPPETPPAGGPADIEGADIPTPLPGGSAATADKLKTEKLKS
ncbi:hypothetical protein [Geminisphaera colitermitum]|uniref:hypothetical protein n=1 Tax=Geminisphaera colitermitum TaxID=1148786 RepID=UPI000158C8E7|nr:hypothetical protein [Geminisphaera colitermitum]